MIVNCNDNIKKHTW